VEGPETSGLFHLLARIIEWIFRKHNGNGRASSQALMTDTPPPQAVALAEGRAFAMDGTGISVFPINWTADPIRTQAARTLASARATVDIGSAVRSFRRALINTPITPRISQSIPIWSIFLLIFPPRGVFKQYEIGAVSKCHA
jgi:hypothetical protein